ncbi:MAG TPA: MBL fold metallo-hydrolase [Vicinamibacterales bacterium]|nr:MBL fold metallo-hydrolase [Vicinamibacterales bacterium]
MILDRRQLLIGAAGALMGGMALPRRAAAQQAGRVALTDRLSVLTSGRTNVVALTTVDGLVLVDSGAPELSESLMADLKPLSNGRVSTVFNTHWHPENTGANEALRQAGATIVAHENTRLWMATPTWIPAEDRYRQPRPRDAHPTKTFYVNGSMNAGGERIDYGYLIEAHTSGDIYVFFRDSNVLVVGDVAAPAQDPVLDYFTGAWIGGRLDALTRLVELSDDRTRIVPGVGPLMTRTELQAERDMMKIVYDRTVDRVREGDDVEDMINAGVLKGLRTLKDPRTFIHDVHKGLWAHHNKLSPNVV